MKMLHVYLPALESDRYALARGPVRDLAGRLRIVCHWSPKNHGYLVRQDRVGDLEVLAQLEGGWRVMVHRHREAA